LSLTEKVLKKPPSVGKQEKPTLRKGRKYSRRRKGDTPSGGRSYSIRGSGVEKLGGYFQEKRGRDSLTR